MRHKIQIECSDGEAENSTHVFLGVDTAIDVRCSVCGKRSLYPKSSALFVRFNDTEFHESRFKCTKCGTRPKHMIIRLVEFSQHTDECIIETNPDYDIRVRQLMWTNVEEWDGKW